MRLMKNDEEGWVLLETVALGMIVLAAAAAMGIFARTALLMEHSAARMEAALLTRARFSAMEAALDQGTPPAGMTEEIVSNGVAYHMETGITHTEEFYDVHIRASWEIMGRTETTDFVRRLRHHVREEKQS